MSDHTPGGLGVDGAATAPGITAPEASHGTAAPEAAQQARYSEGHLATAPFEARVGEALADARLQGAMRAGTERLSGAYGAVAAATPDFALLRRRAAEIRAETLRGLDRHLDTLAANVERNGGHVFFARDAAAACSYVLEVARRHGVRRAVKSKSMISEEIGLNHVLQDAGVETLETDLGEYIVQQAGEMPAHIVIPALHKTVDQVAGLFGTVLGHDLPPEPPRLTAAVRAVLREAFLTADMGITGVNFAVAESGTLAIVSNEGNVDLCTALPRVHVALMGLERLVPAWDDLAPLLRVLPMAGTGQRITTYTSFLSGPRRPDEPDGPEETHLVILDNGRAAILGTEFADVLRCIRCGACLNVCPIYRNIGGHAYGSVYPGPIGAVLSPLLMGDAARDLPYASSLCGACTEACPVGIPLHDLLIKHRQRDVAAGKTDPAERLAFRLLAQSWSAPGTFRWTSRVGSRALRILGGLPGNDGGWIGRLPGPGVGWTSVRDFPAPRGEPFHERWSRLFREDQDLAPRPVVRAADQERPGLPDTGDSHPDGTGEPAGGPEVGDPRPRPEEPEVGDPRTGPESGDRPAAPSPHPDRADFLARVRANLALGAERGAADARHARAPAAGPRPAASVLHRPVGVLAERFVEEIARVGGSAEIVPTADAALAAVVGALAAAGATSAIVTADVPLEQAALRAALRGGGIEAVDATPGASGSLATVAAGVTGAAYAIADTGTLVLVPGDGTGRLPALLPPVHVAVLSLTGLVPDLAAACALLGERGRASALPGGVTLATGPSRSSDIGGALVRGVHGPGRVHVIFVRDTRPPAHDPAGRGGANPDGEVPAGREEGRQ